MDVFIALSEPRRRRIVEILAKEGRLSAGQIYEKFDVTAQAISQHLRILLEAKLLRMEKLAQRHIYSINPSSLRGIEQWAARVEGMWNESLDKLTTVLDEEKRRHKIE